ncbi:hypothetical protein SUDANB178_07531 [Streptomyces sp. enrichment culture]
MSKAANGGVFFNQGQDVTVVLRPKVASAPPRSLLDIDPRRHNLGAFETDTPVALPQARRPALTVCSWHLRSTRGYRLA